MIYKFRTPCHPLANDRTPQVGDEAYALFFPTDDGGKVSVLMGRHGFVTQAACMAAMMRDNPDLIAEVSEEAAKILAGPVQFGEAFHG